MADRIEECLTHPDWWFSFAGNVTFKRAEDLRLAALRVPADRLLVETDAPVSGPGPMRGKPNQPAYVVRTAQALALERRVSYVEFERASRPAPPPSSDGDGSGPRAGGRRHAASWARTSSSTPTSSG